jgi:hypothetical protein
MKQYNVGKIFELPIVFIFKIDDIKNVEKCIKENLKKYQYKNKTEIYKINLEFIKDTVEYCGKKNALLLKQNLKLLKNKKLSNWLVIIDKKNLNI